MSSYKKWDRDAYIQRRGLRPDVWPRVGGERKAEQRRKALMARQSGHRLACEL